MFNDMYTIVERLAILEGRIATKESKPSDKKPVPALFKNLQQESPIPMVHGMGLGEEQVEEDVLSKVKDSFTDYLKSLEDEIKQDRELLAKKKQDLDIKKKELKDLDLHSLEEDPNQTPATGEAPASLTDPTYAESAPVKTFDIDESGDPALGSGGGGYPLVEIHGDEKQGFKIRRGDRELPTRFKSLADAEMALEMFLARRKAQQNSNADYLEER